MSHAVTFPYKIGRGRMRQDLPARARMVTSFVLVLGAVSEDQRPPVLCKVRVVFYPYCEYPATQLLLKGCAELPPSVTQGSVPMKEPPSSGEGQVSSKTDMSQLRTNCLRTNGRLP